jgi:5-(carboxyamino)imidazole ribonucleotide synthase
MKKMPPILPGSAIGVLGSGQLGRMFAIAARQMGYRVHTLSPDSDTPTGQVADVEIKASYDDLDAVRRFARGVKAVTFEFENIPFATARAAAVYAPVRPSGDVLHVSQHRLREKTFLHQAGFPVTPFRVIRTEADLDVALRALGPKAVLKTAGFGYDGKGQRKITSLAAGREAFRALGGRECVLEAFVDFECEMSVVAARGTDGTFVHYGIIRNDHKNHILDVSVAPADLPTQWARQTLEITRGVLEKLNVVGVMCVEFFLTSKGPVINELAPRPHNSGHLTVDACVTSQFEQQLRAVCGLPLGATDYLRPAAMVNLLGDLWTAREPRWANVLKDPAVKLHLYGKAQARPGRKMGHLTALADTPVAARRKALAARAAL